MPYEVVDPPRGLSYAAPAIDFGIIGNLPETYYKGQQNRRTEDIASTFKGGLPIDPTTGQPDYAKAMAMLAAKGDIGAVNRLASPQLDQSLIQRAGQISPLLGGASTAGATAAAPQMPSPAPAAPQSIPAPPVGPPARGGGDNAGSVVDIVSSRLPQDSPTTGAVIVNIAKAAGVDPNAPLDPQQSARVQRMADAYAARTGQARAPTGPAQAAGPPAATVDARFPVMAAAGGPSGLPQIVPGGGQPETARTAETQTPPPPNAAPAQGLAGGQQAGPTPIIPPVPLPPGYTDPQQAIMALRREAARRAAGGARPEEIKQLDGWADRIETSIAPMKLGQSDTIIDPRTQQVLAQGPMAKALAGGAGGINPATLDADAERYRQTGQLPPNMGRGVQGQAEAAAIRARAVEHEVAAGGNPSEWPTRWQEYRATGIGLSAGARTQATREKNLDLILKVTDAAIPAALEQSAKVARTGWVPINRIIQKGEVMASNPELRAFGMANLQLAEGWARAMNPTGVMRESDREKALEFLSTADSPETYRRLVMQLQTQIRRERDSIKGGSLAPASDRPDTPAPGGGAQGGAVVRWERGADGQLRPAQ